MTIRRNEVLSDLSIKTPRDKLETIIITDIYLILLILFKSCFTQCILSYSFSSFNSFQLLPTTESISYSFSLSNTDSHVHAPPHTCTHACACPRKHTKFPPKAQAYFVLTNYAWPWDQPWCFWHTQCQHWEIKIFSPLRTLSDKMPFGRKVAVLTTLILISPTLLAVCPELTIARRFSLQKTSLPFVFS